MDARNWLARRQTRRRMRRLYDRDLHALNVSSARLLLDHPEWPTRRLARQVMREADALLEFNLTLYAQGIGEPFQLARDDSWLREVRAGAERLAGDDGDGSAGVREPRRPLPRTGSPGSDHPGTLRE